MDLTPLSSIVDLGSKIIDRVIPDAAQRDAAKLELMKAQMSGDLETLRVQLSPIIAEAQSTDPLTSRARPAFLYVIYIMILCSIPMGLVSAYDPQIAANVAAGMKAWLAAIPNELYALFGAGYLGYTYTRGKEKLAGVAQ